MTKKIIIDGVNVAECTFSSIGIDKCCYCEEQLYDDGTPFFKCEDEQNCYFKKLKRLEKENEELKEQFEIETLKNNDTNEFIYRSNLLNKYKNALEEIREICTTYAKTESYIIDETFSEFLEIVFNKANEVLK